jgi:hypothetical protein
MRTVLRNSKCIKTFLTIAFLFIFNNGFSTTYYSKVNGVASQIATWGINADGSGAPPANFTTVGDIFIIRVASSIISNKAWGIIVGVTLQIDGTLTISGANRSVVINGRVIFTNPSATQVILAGMGGQGNSFVMNAGSTLETRNLNGIQGVNCSLPISELKKTVTLFPSVNYEFSATAAQLTLGLPVSSIGVLKINNASGVTLSAPTSIATLTIGDITPNTIFNDGGNQITSTGTLNLNNTSTFKLGGTTATIPTTFPGFGIFTINLGSTVEYTAAVAQTILATPPYQNIVISGAGLKTTAVGAITVLNNFTVQSGSSFEVASGSNLTVGNVITNNAGAANFVVNNNANLLQTSTALNIGDITVKRNSNPLYRLDYTMWSSPVFGAQTLVDFSPLTNSTRFYTYNPGTDLYVGVSPTIPFTTGTGYLIRMPNTDPLPGYDAGTATLVYPGVFTGTPNNGSVSIGVGAGTYNAIGNPYPSTIDADLFITGNGIAEALYFGGKQMELRVLLMQLILSLEEQEQVLVEVTL